MNANSTTDWLDDLLPIAVCPDNRSSLRRAPTALVDKLNGLIAQKALRDVTGSLVHDALDAGLIREDNARLYPVRARIPELLPESAILLDDDDRSLLNG